MDFAYIRTVLESAGVTFEHGLSSAEICAAEARVGASFPPDLTAFLGYALPTGDGFPNWRRPDDPALASALAAPLEGICFDIQHNAFWPSAWGVRPTNDAEAFEVARRAVASAPALIPLRHHRYLPAQPNEAGNPIFSVYQTDIICYGANLEGYFRQEYSAYFGSRAVSAASEN